MHGCTIHDERLPKKDGPLLKAGFVGGWKTILACSKCETQDLYPRVGEQHAFAQRHLAYCESIQVNLGRRLCKCV